MLQLNVTAFGTLWDLLKRMYLDFVNPQESSTGFCRANVSKARKFASGIAHAEGLGNQLLSSTDIKVTNVEEKELFNYMTELSSVWSHQVLKYQ